MRSIHQSISSGPYKHVRNECTRGPFMCHAATTSIHPSMGEKDQHTSVDRSSCPQAPCSKRTINHETHKLEAGRPSSIHMADTPRQLHSIRHIAPTHAV
mmetsp:Transcript_19282/g.55267  ORF Transcript_19282/g.55267 Transcript_19282/m.55267 type:complete len:99 (+) Transcript_19282:275-571(+)